MKKVDLSLLDSYEVECTYPTFCEVTDEGVLQLMAGAPGGGDGFAPEESYHVATRTGTFTIKMQERAEDPGNEANPPIYLCINCQVYAPFRGDQKLLQKFVDKHRKCWFKAATDVHVLMLFPLNYIPLGARAAYGALEQLGSVEDED